MSDCDGQCVADVPRLREENVKLTRSVEILRDALDKLNSAIDSVSEATPISYFIPWRKAADVALDATK
jgi:hypothetical protein